MTTSFTETLRLIEASAERAIVQELRIMRQRVVAMCPSLGSEDRAYADGLLLKFDRLIGDQSVAPPETEAAHVAEPAIEFWPVRITREVSEPLPV